MQEYKNDKLVVRYDPAICIHAGSAYAASPQSSMSRKSRGSTSTALPRAPSSIRSSAALQAR